MPSHKKLFTGIAALLLIAGLTLHGGISELFGFVAHAQQNTSNVNIYHEAASKMGILISGFEFLTYIIINLLSALVDPELILGIVNGGQGEEILRSIWQLSRDIMNVIFAFMLIVAALYMVVAPTKSDVVRSNITKFVIGIILVNFSWFFPRVILDVANVTTATIYQIPLLIPDQYRTCKIRDDSSTPDNSDTVNSQPKDCVYLDDTRVFNGAAQLVQQNPNAQTHVAGIVANTTSPMTADKLRTPQGMLYALVYNHGRLGDLTRILIRTRSPTDPNDLSDNISDLIFFIMDTFFVLAMMSMLFFPLLAMLLAFVLRMIVIWLTVAFMPFMFISFVIGAKGGVDTMEEIFWRFVKAAFLPAVVAIPIAAGFIFVNAMAQIPAPAKFAGLDKNTGALILGVNTFWHLLFLITTYMIIWKGFFFAISKSDSIYQGVAQGVQGLGSKLGGGVLKAPLSLPVPIPKAIDIFDGKQDGKTTPGGLFGGGNKFRRPDLGDSAPKQPQEKASSIDNSTALHKDLTNILNELKFNGRFANNKQAGVNEFNRVLEKNSLGDAKVKDINELKDVLRKTSKFKKDADNL